MVIDGLASTTSCSCGIWGCTITSGAVDMKLLSGFCSNYIQTYMRHSVRRDVSLHACQLVQVASSNGLEEERSRRWWPEVFPGVGDLVLQFVRYFILLDALIPISLYVTLELVKLVQCLFLAWDRQLYCAVSDLPFMYKTTTLNEARPLCTLSPERLDFASQSDGRSCTQDSPADGRKRMDDLGTAGCTIYCWKRMSQALAVLPSQDLGQVEYVLTDKTGEERTWPCDITSPR